MTNYILYNNLKTRLRCVLTFVFVQFSHLGPTLKSWRNPLRLNNWSIKRCFNWKVSEVKVKDLYVYVSLKFLKRCTFWCYFIYPKRGSRAGVAWHAVSACRTGGLAGLRRHHGLQPLAPPPSQQPRHTALCGDWGRWVSSPEPSQTSFQWINVLTGRSYFN